MSSRLSAATHSIRLVDTLQGVEECVADLHPLPPVGPTLSIAVDVEGVDLSRHGRVSLIQMVKKGGNTIWLLDVTTLGRTAFEHEDEEGRSIRKVLESVEIKKILYDVRNDSDALYQLYSLLELAWRKSHRRPSAYLNGLARSLEAYVSPPVAWRKLKEEGVRLFSPTHGGSYTIFEERPLDPRILLYSAQDVAYLHLLETALRGSLGKVGGGWDARVSLASESRLEEAKRPVVATAGRNRALAPAL
ncbi:ribonuclease H-like domain-containing protein [Coprinopsis sp. MPI-PUGE-AT-0042]|nr:ribonuclease H-like domain-containing protein [Coprinopsis sp. MPI-PUGE-AT-0042]